MTALTRFLLKTLSVTQSFFEPGKIRWKWRGKEGEIDEAQMMKLCLQMKPFGCIGSAGLIDGANCQGRGVYKSYCAR